MIIEIEHCSNKNPLHREYTLTQKTTIDSSRQIEEDLENIDEEREMYGSITSCGCYDRVRVVGCRINSSSSDNIPISELNKYSIGVLKDDNNTYILNKVYNVELHTIGDVFSNVVREYSFLEDYIEANPEEYLDTPKQLVLEFNAPDKVVACKMAPGITNEQLLLVLIDRLKNNPNHTNSKISLVTSLLEQCLNTLLNLNPFKDKNNI